MVPPVKRPTKPKLVRQHYTLAPESKQDANFALTEYTLCAKENTVPGRALLSPERAVCS